jgi:hypothetical protein
VALICTLDDEALAQIANIVEAYDVFEENTPVAPQPIVKIAELDGEAYPYAIDAVEAAKVFAETDEGRSKKYTATVTGVAVEGVGYGTATIKKVGSVPVKIE